MLYFFHAVLSAVVAFKAHCIHWLQKTEALERYPYLLT